MFGFNAIGVGAGNGAIQRTDCPRPPAQPANQVTPQLLEAFEPGQRIESIDARSIKQFAGSVSDANRSICKGLDQLVQGTFGNDWKVGIAIFNDQSGKLEELSAYMTPDKGPRMWGDNPESYQTVHLDLPKGQMSLNTVTMAGEQLLQAPIQ